LIGLRVRRGGAVEAWRWTGRGRLRAAPAVVHAADDDGGSVGRVTLVAAWDSGEVHVVDVPTATPAHSDVVTATGRAAGAAAGATGAGASVVRPVAVGRLPAAVFSSPAPSAAGAGHRAVVFVGCRDDFLHCLRIT
jgi:hypothetical protein